MERHQKKSVIVFLRNWQKNKMKELKSIIFLSALFTSPIFFSISTIIGFQYKGAEESPALIIFTVIMISLSIVIILSDFLRGAFSFRRNSLFVVFLLLFFILNFFIYNLNSKISTKETLSFLYFILWGFSAALISIYVQKNNFFKDMVKYLEVLMWILSIAVLFAYIVPMFKGADYMKNLTGNQISYQASSYYASFAFGLNCFFLLYGNSQNRFSFTKKKFYLFLLLILLIAQIIGTFSAGGRGGSVLLLTYGILFCIKLLIDKHVKKKVMGLIVILCIIIAIIIALPKLLTIPFFYSAFNRAFAFVGVNGINWSGTSGRDMVYSSAISCIKKSPILGYGIFHYYNVMNNYPHNLFLELLLQGGIIFFLIGLMIIVLIFYKLFKLIQSNNKYILIGVLWIYAIINLQFSGSYLYDSVFWFSSVFILCSRYNTYKEKTEIQLFVNVL